MRFHLKFSRVKPAAPPAITLGADTNPPVAGPPNQSTTTNLLVAKWDTTAGFPAHRLAIGLKYTGVGAPGAQTFATTVYLWEDQTQAWYQLSTGTLVVGQITFFDCIRPLEPVPTQANQQAPTAGSLALYIFVADPGAGAPNGTYDVVVAPVASIP